VPILRICNFINDYNEFEFSSGLKLNSGCNKFAGNIIARRGEAAIDAEEGGRKRCNSCNFCCMVKSGRLFLLPYKLKYTGVVRSGFLQGISSQAGDCGKIQAKRSLLSGKF
jgi:hypothetical protein